MDLTKHSRILHLIPLTLIILFLAWHMRTTHYSELKWWQFVASDYECGALATSVGIINDGNPLNHVGYPAATMYYLNAFILRTVATLNSHYHEILNVGGLTNIKEVFQMLNKAIHIARLSVAFQMSVFGALLYFLFFYLVKSRIFALLWALFLLSEPHVLYYNAVIRPEALSLIFFFALLYLSVRFFAAAKEKVILKQCVVYFFWAGSLALLAIFSKVQVFPCVGLLLALVIVYLFNLNTKAAPARLALVPARALGCLFIAIVNLLIFPWWATKRPAHLTPDVLEFWAWKLLYGPPPGKESFAAIPLAALLIMFGLTLVFFILSKVKNKAFFINKIFPVILFINVSTLGGILAVYSIGLLGGASLNSYVINTNSFIYATFANFYYRDLMTHNVLNVDNFRRIYEMLYAVPLFIIPFFYVILAGAVWSIIQLIRRKTQNKTIYAYVLLINGLGLGLDILATMRAEIYMFNYGIYSICFYVLGLVLLTGVELRRGQKSANVYLRRGISGVCAGVLILHLYPALTKITKDYKDVDYTRQNFELQYGHSAWQAKFFWEMVDRALVESPEIKAIGDKGRQLAWGHDIKEVARQIGAIDRTVELLTPQDKVGGIDQLIVYYTQQLKFNVYFYNYLNTYADNLNKNGQTQMALMNYSSAIKLLPGFPESYAKRALLYIAIGERANALNDLKAAKRLGAKVDEGTIRLLKAH